VWWGSCWSWRERLRIGQLHTGVFFLFLFFFEGACACWFCFESPCFFLLLFDITCAGLCGFDGAVQLVGAYAGEPERGRKKLKMHELNFWIFSMVFLFLFFSFFFFLLFILLFFLLFFLLPLFLFFIFILFLFIFIFNFVMRLCLYAVVVGKFCGWSMRNGSCTCVFS